MVELSTTPTVPWTVSALKEQALRLLDSATKRHLLGLVGPPGSGKSTLAAQLCRCLDIDTAVVSMDGFHLANRVLFELGLADRKGAPESFDAWGFRHLLWRLRDNTDDVVYAPEFLRRVEEPIAGAIAVARSIPLVIIEGNYLLLDEGPWRCTGSLIDEAWYLDVDQMERRDRLIRRHMEFGRSESEARNWVLAVDEHNAKIVEATADRAHLVVQARAD